MRNAPAKAGFFRRNGLTLVLLVLFFLSWVGHAYMGWKTSRLDSHENIRPVLSGWAYLRSSEFWSTTFENWESEFLQMAIFVVLTVGLRQRGSSESKPLEDENGDEEKKYPKRYFKRSPFLRALYERSLSIALFVLFALSFLGHAYYSWVRHQGDEIAHGETPATFGGHLISPQLWFESFQNWQSEFLSVAVLVVLTIFLRHRGSAQSKAVDAPHDRTE